MVNTNSEFVIDSCRESGENRLTIWDLHTLKSETRIPKCEVPMIVRFCLRHVLDLAES